MGVKLVASSGGSVELVTANTASNFTATVPAGTGTVAVQGISTNIVSGTAVASTSGTSIDFTGIPSWVKRITVMFHNVSTNGVSNPIIQIGTSSGFTTSGYVGYAEWGTTRTAMSSGFMWSNFAAAGSVFAGSVIITNLTSNTWIESGNVADSGTGQITVASAGSIALSGILDRVRITTTNGTDTFDAGSINILYE